MTKPLTTIVIPCHNKAKTITRAIKSIKEQTANNLECFIVLDRCTDNSQELAIQAIDNDSRFSLSTVDFGNVADTRNYGIAQGDAPFVCCLDADDWIEPEFLETCLKPMLEDRSLGIVYTGLKWHREDGVTGQGGYNENGVGSPWPPHNPNYDLQIKKRSQDNYRGFNQVPTCCVFRREAWVRTGGYRERYTGNSGAGSEDAAFWTAIGSIGYKIKSVSNKLLFNYSEGGLTKEDGYSEPNWLSFFPWVDDNNHPFASIATPKKHSHPVRQYDEPKISVIIPVGPGHEKDVRNAIDSLEMQHFRQWEAIVYNDTSLFDYQFQKDYLLAYPYVRLIGNENSQWGKGAGYARNRGVEAARAPLVLYLDADDIFNDAYALDKMLSAWNKEKAIIYSDYLGKATRDYDETVREFGQLGTGRFIGWREKTQQAIMRHYASDYDCKLAQQQPKYDNNRPNNPYFHWALVSCLVPKVWHNAIGGFDETMETWEDVDYHWRLARAGYCFSRIEEPLFLYNYDGGHRREVSRVKDETTRQKHQKMIEYIKDKYTRIDTVMCNCKTKSNALPVITSTAAGLVDSTGAIVQDDNMILVEFTPDYTGDRALVGVTGIKYGYGRKEGDRFYVHKDDIAARPKWFRPVSQVPHVEAIDELKQELPEPEPVIPEPKYTPVEPEVESKVLEALYGGYSAVDLVELIKSDNSGIDLQQLLDWENAKEKPRKTVVNAIKKQM